MELVGYYPVRLVEEILEGDRIQWFAEHPYLRGCHGLGETQTQAMEALDRAREVWLEWAAQHGVTLPAPLEDPQTTIIYAQRPFDQTMTTDLEVDPERIAV